MPAGLVCAGNRAAVRAAARARPGGAVELAGRHRRCGAPCHRARAAGRRAVVRHHAAAHRRTRAARLALVAADRCAACPADAAVPAAVRRRRRRDRNAHGVAGAAVLHPAADDLQRGFAPCRPMGVRLRGGAAGAVGDAAGAVQAGPHRPPQRADPVCGGRPDVPGAQPGGAAHRLDRRRTDRPRARGRLRGDRAGGAGAGSGGHRRALGRARHRRRCARRYGSDRRAAGGAGRDGAAIALVRHALRCAVAQSAAARRLLRGGSVGCAARAGSPGRRRPARRGGAVRGARQRCSTA